MNINIWNIGVVFCLVAFAFAPSSSASPRENESSFVPVEAPSETGSHNVYESGTQYGECTDVYYDARNYNWMSIRNNCGIDVTATFNWGNGTRGGAIDLDSGKSGSTGMSSKEVTERGGILVAICRRGFIPVDSDDKNWLRGSYRCRKLF
jgi:hypothetical protein